MHTDHAYQKAKDLYKSLAEPTHIPTEILKLDSNADGSAVERTEEALRRRDDRQLNDRLYLAHYAEQIVDQFSLKDCQNQAMGRTEENWLKPATDKECKHTLSKFTKQAHGLLQDGSSRAERDASVGGVSNAAAAHSNFQAFRFLWSSKSQILSVHFIQLNPYMLQT